MYTALQVPSSSPGRSFLVVFQPRTVSSSRATLGRGNGKPCIEVRGRKVCHEKVCRHHHLCAAGLYHFSRRSLGLIVARNRDLSSQMITDGRSLPRSWKSYFFQRNCASVRPSDRTVSSIHLCSALTTLDVHVRSRKPNKLETCLLGEISVKLVSRFRDC